MALSDEQLGKLKNYIETLFEKYDLDGNCVLDKDECKGLLKECLVTLKYNGISSAGDVSEDMVDKVYDVIDSDGNALVDKEELTNFIMENCKHGIATAL